MVSASLSLRPQDYARQVAPAMLQSRRTVKDDPGQSLLF
jgi:hypothetical protein